MSDLDLASEIARSTRFKAESWFGFVREARLHGLSDTDVVKLGTAVAEPSLARSALDCLNALARTDVGITTTEEETHA